MKIWILIAVVLSLGLFSGLIFITASNTPITFESLESKTELGAPVFNQVKLIPGWARDVWLMRQSHHGFDPDYSRWDRLAIVVEKNKRPYRATFYQYAPGSELQFAGANKPVPYKARCFACHANGPRAVRPEFNSPIAALNTDQKIAIALWNLRIKTYGRVASVPGQNSKEGAPFKSAMPILSRPLGIQTCIRCHSDHGIRNELKLEHLGTARFLVKRGIMPPFPFTVLPEEVERMDHLAREGQNQKKRTEPRCGDSDCE